MKQFFITLAAVLVAMLIMAILPMLFLGMALSLASLSSDEPIKESTVLTLDLSETIVDRADDSPANMMRSLMSGNTDSEHGLNTLTDALNRAASDANIAALVLKGSGVAADFAIAREVRQAISDFKELSGKPVLFFDNDMSGGSLYVASVADSIFTPPMGTVALIGVTSQKFYLKRLADKLGIGFEVIKHGKFKSAIEPYFRDSMSPEDREQTQRMVDCIWSEMRDSIAARRGVSAKAIDDFVDNYTYITNRTAPVELGLIDRQIYNDQFLATLKTMIGKKETDLVPMVSIYSYEKSCLDADPEANATTKAFLNANKDKVAVVYAVGEIYDGTGDGSTTDIYGNDLIETLRKVRIDSTVKAVVLRVNSPGGSAAASDLIWREVDVITNDKPVIVSMGGYAASGGYYISCAADYIVAEPNTITGSIGVYGMVPNVEKMATDAGVDFSVVSSTQNPPVNITKKLKPEHLAALQTSVENTYTTFVNRVAAGRDMTFAQVDSIAQGRVWVGSDALSIGLIDAIGNIDDAIDQAIELSGVTDYTIVEYPEIDNSPMAILKQFGLNTKATIGSWLFGPDFTRFTHLRQQIESTPTPYAIMSIYDTQVTF